MNDIILATFGKNSLLFLLISLFGLLVLKLHVAGETGASPLRQVIMTLLPLGTVRAAFRKYSKGKAVFILLFTLAAWALILFFLYAHIQYRDFLHQLSIT